MSINISAESWQVLVAFGLYLAGCVALGYMSHHYLQKRKFMASYFLGDRGLGAWVLALTVAATAISGGTFMGFPSLIYSNGWIMGLWICSYMVVPLTTMVLLGKRLNQAARLSGAVTLPDVMRDRFASPALGIVSSLLILVCLIFNLVAQFKAGGLVLKEAMRLPPAAATFVKADVDKKGGNLVLAFEVDGTTDTQKVPLPSEKATFLKDRTQVREEQRQVRVVFDVEGETVEKVVPFPPAKLRVPWLRKPVETAYLIGLAIFTLTVVAYTTYGGYWAVTLTDLLAGLVMLAGVIVMAVLAVRAVEPVNGYTGLAAATEHLRQITPPEGEKGDLVYGPGPKHFLPLGLAFSFFLMWSIMGAGQPSGLVRLMSFKDARSLRRALMLIAGYYIVIYVSLLIIFVCARAMLPTQYLREIGSEGEPDSIMPVMARRLAHPLVAGLLLAAPYAAIMSTVAAFLLMISSSLVRDLYQRVINPTASQKTLRRASYAVTGLVGLVVMLGAINPPAFLQYIIVFTASGQGCAFLAPVGLALYWRRTTRQGALAGMLGGFVVVVGLYALGWINNHSEAAVREYREQAAHARQAEQPEPEMPSASTWLQENLRWIPGWGQKPDTAFEPLHLGGLDPLVWGLAASLLLTIGISLATRPDPALLAKYFP
ncbi:MAG: hypothetical protein HYS12_25185 [Planctomycetes bacterium]|nr:hypothetical protein [Planctomycetota bacterium]